MNNTEIEWCDSTWNPITGCLHGCEYCYARGIARRFEGVWDGDSNCKLMYLPSGPPKDITGCENDGLGLKYRVGSNKQGEPKLINAPYPYGFHPTIHRHRLETGVRRWKKPRTVFVGSMADMFGDWVPYDWIRRVFDTCESAPWHRYLFLTKNPSRYIRLFEKQELKPHDNYWYGTTITKPSDLYPYTNIMPYNLFLSIEPLLEEFGDGNFDPSIKWVIIGAMSGAGAKNHQPRREWVEDIVARCRSTGTPVFMKNSLIPIMGEENMLREFPW